MKILLIDDSKMVRTFTLKFLHSIGYTDIAIQEAENGVKGLGLFRSFQPDILFLDLLMPEMTGTDFLNEIQNDEHQCFVVVVSSNFQKPVQDRVLNLGAHLFIEKPITMEKIQRIMTAYHAFKEK